MKTNKNLRISWDTQFCRRRHKILYFQACIYSKLIIRFEINSLQAGHFAAMYFKGDNDQYGIHVLSTPDVRQEILQLAPRKKIM